MQRVKSHAGKVVAKLSPILIQADQLSKEKMLEQVPSVLASRLKSVTQKLREFHDEAETKLSYKSPLDLNFDSGNLAPVVKEGGQVRDVVQNMFNGIRNMGSWLRHALEAWRRCVDWCTDHVWSRVGA